ncbi:MAG: protein NosL [Nitrosomonadales bacterium]|nr:protein NosL [Nitrosomonadales bacterium]
MSILNITRNIFPFGAALLLLAACSKEPQAGPVEIKFDRDTCVRCSMAISDRHYAAQVRGGPKKQTFKFDDLGCAISWLNNQPWGNDRATEIWVADSHAGLWLNARTAYFVSGKTTPMAYGFGATTEAIPGSISFDEARKQVLAKDK